MATHSNGPSIPRIKQEPGIINGIKIKDEPGLRTNERLTTFRLPRDLTLSGINANRTAKSTANKKVYTPNLNVVRNKNTDVKTSRDTSIIGRARGRGDRGARTDSRGGYRGGRGRGLLVQTSGLFSEGSGETHTKRISSGWKSTDESSSSMKRPIYIKRELKIDSDDEKKEISLILGEDDDNDSEESNFSSEICVPIELNECSSKSDVKEKRNIFGIKTEKLELYPKTLDSLFSRQEPQIILIQLPDSLPGQTFVNDPPDGQSSQQTAPATEMTTYCTMKELDEGFMGKLVRYKSGKTKLILGQSRFDINLGIEPGLLQEAMSVDTNSTERSGKLINLGHVNAKLSATPDWEFMLMNRTS